MYDDCCGTRRYVTNVSGSTIINDCVKVNSVLPFTGNSRPAIIRNIQYTGSCSTLSCTPTPTPTSYKLAQALTGLKIEAIFISALFPTSLPTGYEFAPIPNTNPVQYYGFNYHNCNAAWFYAYANGVKVLDVILNNNVNYPPPGTLCENFDNRPFWDLNPNSLSRYSSVILDSQQATQLASLSLDQQTISFNLVCAKTLTPHQCNDSYPPDVCHSDITWIRISKSDGTVVFNGGVDTFNTFTINVFQ
jgi:hypothetical protein